MRPWLYPCLFIFLLAQSIAAFANTKKCGDLGISFHGEIRYAQTIDYGPRKGEIERIQLIRPLGPTYGVNSNDWKRVFVEIPMSLKIDASQIKIETRFKLNDSNTNQELTNGPFSLGNLEKGFYPLSESQFASLIPEGPFAPGQLTFTLKQNGLVMCSFTLETVEAGD